MPIQYEPWISGSATMGQRYNTCSNRPAQPLPDAAHTRGSDAGPRQYTRQPCKISIFSLSSGDYTCVFITTHFRRFGEGNVFSSNCLVTGDGSVPSYHRIEPHPQGRSRPGRTDTLHFPWHGNVGSTSLNKTLCVWNAWLTNSHTKQICISMSFRILAVIIKFTRKIWSSVHWNTRETSGLL